MLVRTAFRVIDCVQSGRNAMPVVGALDLSAVWELQQWPLVRRACECAVSTGYVPICVSPHMCDVI